MLDRLVESRSNSQENTRRTGFLLTVFILMTMLMVGGWLYSLFAKDFGMSDDLQLSSLVAPVPVTEDKPPEPEPEKPEKQEQKQEKVDITTRKTNTLAMTESPKIPDKVSNEKAKNKERPTDRPFQQSDAPERDASPSSSMDRGGNESGSGGGLPMKTKDEEPKKDEPKPDVKPPPPPPAPKPVPKVISGGVVNGKAISLPKPIYPAPARAVGAKGAVNVSVTIDESGNVISASATSGHPLLRQAAVAAARSARFAPTQLSGQPVKVQGIIIYNFNQ